MLLLQFLQLGLGGLAVAFGAFVLRVLGAGKGYIAGEDVGIVTVLGQPAERHVWLFLREVNNLRIIADTWSDKNGNYRFDNLNTELRYLVMAADNYDGKYEPIAYDMAKPYVP